MIKELQNQDPLNPMDNKDMLAQLSQIRQVGATDKLTQTLDSVLLGQNISSATNLIGAKSSALSDDNEKIDGIVDRISIDNGSPKLHVENPATVGLGDAPTMATSRPAHTAIAWSGTTASGNLIGLDFSGNQAITTTGTEGVDQAIQLRNLACHLRPQTSLPHRFQRHGRVSTRWHDHRRQAGHVCR